MKFPREMIWAVRVPAFAGALSLYTITAIVLTLLIHGWRAPLTALHLLPRLVRMLAVKLLGRPAGANLR